MFRDWSWLDIGLFGLIALFGFFFLALVIALCYAAAESDDQENRARFHRFFHNHLRMCERCSDNPFELCEIGDRLARRAAGVEEVGCVNR